MSKLMTFGLVSLLPLACLVPKIATAAIGTGSLEVVGANSTPTHFDIPIEVPTTATICGVSIGEAGNPLPATLTVWVKSSTNGNTMLTANQVGATNCYEFSYTPPSWACNTTIVSYADLGLNSNNDVADDGVVNGTATAAAGFRFVNADGDVIGCVVPIDATTWSSVKGIFR